MQHIVRENIDMSLIEGSTHDYLVKDFALMRIPQDKYIYVNSNIFVVKVEDVVLENEQY